MFCGRGSPGPGIRRRSSSKAGTSPASRSVFRARWPGGKGDRAPSAAERTLCAPWLAGELALVRPELIVTLGRLAAAAFIPGARRLALGELVGSVWIADQGYGEIPVVPLPHPSGVSRWLNNPANRILVDRALDQLGALRAGGRR